MIYLPENDKIQLVYDAQNGSNFAMAQLLQENYSIVYKFILKLTLDPQTAADITQECMVRVIDKFKLYDPHKSALSTWMITIAKNLWIEECRRNKVNLKYEKQYRENEEADFLNQIIDKDEVLSALKKLNKKLRVPIVLKHAEGYSYEDIAKTLNIPIGTVKSRISNGIKFLKKELEHYER